MEHFLKIVHTLLDRHAPFKSFNKKLNIYSSKPWIKTDIAKSIKAKENLNKNFSGETNLQKKVPKPQFRTYQNYILLCSDAQRTHITMNFLKKTKEMLKQSGKHLRN